MWKTPLIIPPALPCLFPAVRGKDKMAGYDKVKTNKEACLLPRITKTKAGTDILILLVEVKKKADRGKVLETLKSRECILKTCPLFCTIYFS